MTSLIVILILVSALTATSSALSCTECASPSSACSGNSITCPDGSLCGSVYSEIYVEGKRAEILVRGCILSSDCNLSGSVRHNQGRTAIATSCCRTHGCIPILPTLPTQSSIPNGVTCRSCVAAQSWCYTSDTIQCTGDENMCLLQITETPGSDSTALRGCATKSYCDLGSQSHTAGRSSSTVKTTCTNGGISAHNVFLTPAIVCLLLLKLFL